MLSLITVVGLAYLLVCFTGYLLARATFSDKDLRKLFSITSVLVLPLTLWALIKTRVKGTRPLPYHEGLAAIEDEIEADRVRLFGEKPLKPSVSEAWKLSWIRRLGKATGKVESLVNSDLASSINAAAG